MCVYCSACTTLISYGKLHINNLYYIVLYRNITIAPVFKNSTFSLIISCSSCVYKKVKTNIKKLSEIDEVFYSVMKDTCEKSSNFSLFL